MERRKGKAETEIEFFNKLHLKEPPIKGLVREKHNKNQNQNTPCFLLIRISQKFTNSPKLSSPRMDLNIPGQNQLEILQKAKPSHQNENRKHCRTETSQEIPKMRRKQLIHLT